MTQYGLSLVIISWVVASMPPIVTAAQPGIDYPPLSQSVILHQPAAFGVIANGKAPFSYQWRKDGATVAGATNDQIFFPHAQFSDAGLYSVVVSNAEGSAISADAALTVNPPKAGDLDYSFECCGSIVGEVLSVAVQPDGKVLIAGDFSSAVNYEPHGKIARLNADGTTDHTFMIGLAGPDPVKGSGNIAKVLIQGDGKVVIIGSFTTINGERRIGIARLNADGTLDHTFQDGEPGIWGDVASAVVQQDGKVLIGGYITAVNAESRTNIARLNADGTLDNSFQTTAAQTRFCGCWFDFSGVPVMAIAIQSDGKVLIGGRFDTVNGVSRNRLARLNSDGTLDSSFQDGLPADAFVVDSIAVQRDGKVLVAGGFWLARLNPDGTMDATFVPVAGSGPITIQSDGKVLAGNGSAGIVRFNADGTLDTGFNPVVTRSVSSVAVQGDGKILVGGAFSWSGIARLNVDGSLDGAFQSRPTGLDREVNSILLQDDGKVIISGAFTTVNGNGRTRIVRLNADGTLDTEFQPSPPAELLVLRSVALQRDGKVLIGGETFSPLPPRGSPLVRLNADDGLDSGFQTEVNSQEVKAVAVQEDGKVLIGGSFITVNGRNRNGIARLNNDGTLDAGFQSGLSVVGGTNYPQVTSIALQRDGKAIIGVRFVSANFIGPSGIARLNADGSLDNGFQCAVEGGGPLGVVQIAVQSDGRVMVGGDFNTINGENRKYIARLNSDGSSDSGFLSGPLPFDGYGQVFSVVLRRDDKVLIGSWFTTVKGVAIARLNADGTLDSSSVLPWIGGPVAVQADGKVLIGGYIGIVNDEQWIARLWGSADIPAQFKSINRNGSDINLSWYAVSNRTYRVQYTANPSSNAWTDLTGDVSASGATASKTDSTLGNSTQRFYRVVLP